MHPPHSGELRLEFLKYTILDFFNNKGWKSSLHLFSPLLPTGGLAVVDFSLCQSPIVQAVVNPCSGIALSSAPASIYNNESIIC